MTAPLKSCSIVRSMSRRLIVAKAKLRHEVRSLRRSRRGHTMNHGKFTSSNIIEEGNGEYVPGFQV